MNSKQNVYQNVYGLSVRGICPECGEENLRMDIVRNKREIYCPKCGLIIEDIETVKVEFVFR